jgi:Ca-activated chloride channel family protein
LEGARSPCKFHEGHGISRAEANGTDVALSPVMKRLTTLAILVFGGCADMGAASDSPTGGGGGNVSFGGAQDMGQFRAMLDRGEVPGPGTLDANGFFNEHFNAIPPNACTGELCLTPGISIGRDWMTGKHQATLQIAVSTPRDPSEFPRLPMNLVVVVDHSGSMASDMRLEKVKTGLHTLVDNIEDGDRISIISFDDTVTIDAPFTDTVDREALHTTIDRLQPRGGTNIYEGLRQGFNLLGEYPSNVRQNRVIFLSDGLATVGDTSQTSILAMAKTWIGKGIGLTTIGVGNDFDVELMRGLAENGAGNYYFLEDAAAAGEVFTEELDFFMTPLALDIKIEATAGSGWTLGEVVGSRIWTAGPKTGSMSIPAAFVASRTSQEPGEGRRGGGSMIFIHLEPTADADTKIADLRLTYRAPGTTETVTQNVALDYASDPLETPDEPYLSGAEMAERYAMYNLFLGFRAATNTYDGSCAAAALVATRTQAVAWNERHADPDIEADLVLLDKFLANLRNSGATSERDLATCPTADEPYGGEPDYDEEWEGGYNHGHYGCMSASKGSAGWMLVIGATLFVAARRRRRPAARV